MLSKNEIDALKVHTDNLSKVFGTIKNSDDESESDELLYKLHQTSYEAFKFMKVILGRVTKFQDVESNILNLLLKTLMNNRDIKNITFSLIEEKELKITINSNPRYPEGMVCESKDIIENIGKESDLEHLSGELDILIQNIRNQDNG